MLSCAELLTDSIRRIFTDDSVSRGLRRREPAVLTGAAQPLLERGEADTVRHIRRKYQDAMRDDLIAVVEGLTGRKVTAFLSDNHMDPDIAVEVFMTDGVA